MYSVITHGCCTGDTNHYRAKVVKLVLDSPAYEEAQFIAFIHLDKLLGLSRVNKVEEVGNGLLIVHIA